MTNFKGHKYRLKKRKTEFILKGLGGKGPQYLEQNSSIFNSKIYY